MRDTAFLKKSIVYFVKENIKENRRRSGMIRTRFLEFYGRINGY